jgi:hypothetical protein
MRIRIAFPKGEIFARLDDTPTAKALMQALPVNSSASTWGQEVYFPAPVSVDLEADAREVVEPGTVCFWVQGNSLALPFGPTPASHADECRLVTRVNVLGMLEGDAKELAAIEDGDEIQVSAA